LNEECAQARAREFRVRILGRLREERWRCQAKSELVAVPETSLVRVDGEGWESGAVGNRLDFVPGMEFCGGRATGPRNARLRRQPTFGGRSKREDEQKGAGRVPVKAR